MDLKEIRVFIGEAGLGYATRRWKEVLGFVIFGALILLC